MQKKKNKQKKKHFSKKKKNKTKKAKKKKKKKQKRDYISSRSTLLALCFLLESESPLNWSTHNLFHI